MSKTVIQIDVESELENIIRQFHRLPDQLAAPSVLKNSLNSAARKVRKQMLADVKEEYALTRTRILRDKSQGAPQLFTASPSNLSAAIRSRGPMQEIMSFTTRPNTRTEAAKAHVLASTALRALERGGRKAFLAVFAGGRQAIVERRGPERWPVRTLLSPSVPQMLGKEAVLSHAEDRAYALLQAEIQKRVEQINLR